MLIWLYELPLWIPLGLGIAGLILIWTGLTRLEKRLKLAGMIVLALGIVLGLLSWFLESDREIVERQTRTLIKAVERRDWETARSLLAPDMTVLGFGPRDEVVAVARKYAEQYHIQNLRIIGLKASEPGTAITVKLRILADVHKSPAGFTDWQLEWEKTDSRWELKSADSNDVRGLEAMIPRGL